MTFVDASVAGEESEEFADGRVWERSVCSTGEELVPDWGDISMEGLETMEAEG